MRIKSFFARTFVLLVSFIFIGSVGALACSGDGDSTDLACGLVADWTLSDTPVSDVSGNGNVGTATGTTIITGCPMGGCRSFNGAGDDVNVGTLGSFGANDAAMNTTGVTFSVWFKTLATGEITIMGNNPSNGVAGIVATLNEGQFSSPSPGALYFGWTQTTNYGVYGTAVGNAQIYNGNWHHWVVTIPAGLGSMNMYLDGVALNVSVNTEGYSQYQTWSIAPYLSIGADVNSASVLSNYYRGYLNDMRIYSRVLSPSEITALYNTGNPNAGSPIANTTYYIDYSSGSDSNNGTSKSTPWKRAPGMNGFTGTYVPQVGDHFIFKGGVTWPNAAFPFTIANSGASGNPDYFGVDKTWCAGSGWTRPLFDLNYTLLSGNGVPVDIEGQNYITIDNLEIAHMAISSSAPYGAGSIDAGSITPSNNIIVQNNYVHDWRPLSTTVDEDNGGIFFNGNGDIANSNIVGPGQEPGGTYSAASGCCIRNGTQVSNNYLTNCSDMYVGGASLIYGNTFASSMNSFEQSPVFHPNAIWHNNAAGQNTYIYNNVFYDQDTEYQLMLLHPGWGGATNSYYYIYNNIAWNVNAAINIDEAGIVAANSNTGAYAFNNTINEGISILNRGQAYHLTLVEAENNHWITDIFTGNGFCYNNAGGTGCGTAGTIVDTSNITQGTVAATNQAYALSDLYAPTASADITVSAGLNLTSLGIGSLNTDRLGNSRSASGSWDVGAYQFNPTPPTVNLTTNRPSYTAPASITLTASASATNATINQVSFYNGSTLLGTATASPYTYQWSDAPQGNYILDAVATDSNNKSTTSAVSVTVSAPAFTYGDVNGDGNVTIYDAELTAQYAVGLPVANFNAAAAEVDGNSAVDIYDAYLIAEYAVGIITKFPAQ